MSLTPWQLRLTAHVVAEELARRRRLGIPIPALLIEVHRALNSNLDAYAHESGGPAEEPATIENVKQRARRLGVSESTVKRYARKAGGRKVGRDWVFDI
jgi:hypothetical protein